MRVLVVGGGGREHALVWRLAHDPAIDAILAAPGNAGIACDARCEPVVPDDVDGICALVERERVDLTVVGPESPLVAGLADELTSRGHRAFGPTKDGARIEGSKAWAKELCERYRVPAGRSRAVTEMERALEELEGWDEDLGEVRSFEALPAAARKYLERLQELVDVPIGVVSVGPRREQSLPAEGSGSGAVGLDEA